MSSSTSRPNGVARRATEELLAGGGGDAAVRNCCALRDIDRDVFRVLSPNDVVRHAGVAGAGVGRRVRDLAADDVAKRRERKALELVVAEGIVEIRPDLARGSSVGERMTAAAARP